MSLAEIAENLGITRQGVRDAIKHGEAALDELEAKLGNARRHTRMQAELDRLQTLATEIRCCNSGAYTPDPRITKGYRGNAHDFTMLGHAGGCRWPLSL